MPSSKFSYNAGIGVTWDLASLALREGVDLRANPRSRSQTKLASLTDARFSESNAITQRAGHVQHVVRENAAYLPFSTSESDPWLYGKGHSHFFGTYQTWLRTPDANQSRGVFTRDDELVVWTGDRLLSFDPDNARFVGQSSYWAGGLLVAPQGVPAFVPTAEIRPFGYRQETPTWINHDGAQGRDYRLMAYTGVSGDLFVDVQSVTTGAYVIRALKIYGSGATGAGGALSAGNGPAENLNVLWLNGRFMILYALSANKIALTTMNEADIVSGTPQTAILLTGNSTNWTVSRVNDDRAVIAHETTGGAIHVTYLSSAGTGTETLVDYEVVPAASSGGSLGVGHSPFDDSFCVVYTAAAGAGVWATVWSRDGLRLLAPVQMDTDTTSQHVTVCAQRFQRRWWACWDLTDGITHKVRARAVDVESGASFIHDTTRRGCDVVSNAFRVGDCVFVTMQTEITPALVSVPALRPPQATNALVELTQTPLWRLAGAWCRSTGIIPGDHLPMVAALPDQEPDTASLFYAVAVAAPLQDIVAAVQVQQREPQSVLLDFLPPLRWAQVGRCTYLAGALVQQYDGRTLVESGFVNYPVVTDLTDSHTGSGGLIPGHTRQYRVYAVSRNAQGELTRSAALSTPVHTIGGGDDTCTITFSALPFTNRDTITYEIYATQNAGTTFYLLTSTVPYEAPVNSVTALTLTYVDALSDSQIGFRPEDPHQALVGAPAELLNFPPPGCSVIAAGLDRLWFASGEVAHGHVACSKINVGGQCVAYSPLVGDLPLDRADDTVTAIRPLDEATLIFRPSRILVLTGSGPDNLGQGQFDPARVVSSETGAIQQEGCERLSVGVTFQSATGPRLVTPGFQAVNIGSEVQTLMSGQRLSGACVVPDDNQVRFYVLGDTSGRAAVWDYAVNQWAVHTGLQATGVVQWYGRAAIARPDGPLWIESDDVDNDAGRPIAYGLRTSELRPSDILQASHRFRRVGLTGQWRGPHTLLIRVRYDGAEDPSEEWTWNAATDLPVAVADPSTPLSAIFPDHSAATGSPDGVYRVTRRLARQRASSVSFEILARNNSGDSFVINELVLECGTKPGLRKHAQRTTTTNYASHGDPGK